YASLSYRCWPSSVSYWVPCARTSPPSRSTLFPYTTLFRSRPSGDDDVLAVADGFEEHLLLRRGQDPRPDVIFEAVDLARALPDHDRKSTRLNSSHGSSSYAVFCLNRKSNSR